MSHDSQGVSAQIITTFTFDQLDVRTVVLDGQVWFVGIDVAEALGYTNPNKAIGDHCRGLTKRYPIPDSIGRLQETRLISEPDMFRLIVNSHLPAAERFERWVFEDVLPTLRRTGTYSVPGRTNQPTIGNQTQSWRLIDRLKRENDRDLRRLYYAQLQSVLAEQGLPTPPLSSMGADAPEEPPAVRVLWEAVAALEAMGVRLNHSRDPALVAINPRHLTAAALDHGVRLMGRGDLMRAMRLSQKPRFLDVRVVNSAIRENSVRCWVFDQASVPAPSADTIDIV